MLICARPEGLPVRIGCCPTATQTCHATHAFHAVRPARWIGRASAVVRLLTLEDHTFAEDAQGGRTSKSIPDWSVAKIKSVGADGTCVRAVSTETLHAARGARCRLYGTRTGERFAVRPAVGAARKLRPAHPDARHGTGPLWAWHWATVGMALLSARRDRRHRDWARAYRRRSALSRCEGPGVVPARRGASGVQSAAGLCTTYRRGVQVSPDPLRM